MSNLIPVGTFVLVEDKSLSLNFFGYVYVAEVDVDGDNKYIIDCRSEERRAEFPNLFLDPQLDNKTDWHIIWDLPSKHGTYITY